MRKRIIIPEELERNVVNYFKNNNDNRISVMSEVFNEKPRIIQKIIDAYLDSLKINKHDKEGIICNDSK